MDRRFSNRKLSIEATAERLAGEKPINNRRLQKAQTDIDAGRLEAARTVLSEYLASHPENPDALSLMARVQLRLGHPLDARRLLERCLTVAPSSIADRFNLAQLLLKLDEYQLALGEIGTLLDLEPDNPLFLALKANILESSGEADQAIEIWRKVLAADPDRAESWISYGHVLRARGSRHEAIAAYRSAIKIDGSCGQAYWSLANVKDFEFDDTEICAMNERLKSTAISPLDRINLQFALGKALEDKSAYAQSFEHYAKGNAAMRLRQPYDSRRITELAQANKRLLEQGLTPDTASTPSSPAPIFILSLPRSGSTLVEQILQSHSSIEGAGELPYIVAMAGSLEEQMGGEGYPKGLADLSASERRALGEQYLKKARVHLRLGRDYFTDKKPSNWLHVALICLAFPDAKIVHVQRHPCACCFSIFKHFFSSARPSLSELGLLYREHVALLASMDRVLPGKIHHVTYERLVGDPETEIRNLLRYLDLPFEEACLRFHESTRTVLTPSAEQVRRPLSTQALDHWQAYKKWLGPLMDSLGSVLTCYPGVPEDLQ